MRGMVVNRTPSFLLADFATVLESLRATPPRSTRSDKHRAARARLLRWRVSRDRAATTTLPPRTSPVLASRRQHHRAPTRDRPAAPYSDSLADRQKAGVPKAAAHRRAAYRSQ